MSQIDIDGVLYEKPYMKFSSNEQAQLFLDAISYRMSFALGKYTERLAEVIQISETEFIIPHPLGVGYDNCEQVMCGLNCGDNTNILYQVVEFNPEWVAIQAEV